MQRLAVGIVCVLASFAVLNGQDRNEAKRDKQPHESKEHHAGMHHEMHKMNQKMVQHLGQADPKYDLRFIDMMIPHHEGAVLMARDALTKATHPELKEQAKKIIESQEKEIAQMKKWRSEWYGKADAKR